ncbi:DUF2199 domain-containing protein [Vibrio campbellii]|nr:DUF2199 domain-containing protein [Vibrio campbellii]
MKCGCCGKEIGDFVFDKSYQMPDEIWELSDEIRDERAKIHSDLCRLDSRYFIRGVLYLPVHAVKKCFGWGVWVEVSQGDFFNYFEKFDLDNSNESPFSGAVANSLPSYPETRGMKVQVRLGDSTQRPTFQGMEKGHLLTKEQENGISIERVHVFNGE